MKCSMADERYRAAILTLALPVAMLYLLPAPLLALWKLRGSNREADQTLTVYGFLYSGYKKEYWYWEVLVLVRKIMVAAISVFLSADVSSANDLQVNSSQYQQGLLATLVISIALYIQLKLEPFEDDVFNGVESMGLVVSVMSLYLGLWTFYGNEENYVLDTVITVLIFGINGCWFLYTLVSLFKEYKVVKNLKRMISVITCQKAEKDKDGKDGEGDGSKKGKGAGKKGHDKKGGNVMSDIEMPQTKVINPLLVVGTKKKKDFGGTSADKGTKDDTAATKGPQKVMIKPLQ